MSGRLAAEVLDDALSPDGNSTTLQRYPTMLADEVGRYHQVGRLAARFLGRPTILHPALRLGVRSERMSGAVLRIATNELRDGRPGDGLQIPVGRRQSDLRRGCSALGRRSVITDNARMTG